jgi:hypothetical protein
VANSDTAVSNTLLAGAASRDWERVRVEVERVSAGREEDDERDEALERVEDERDDALERVDDERDEEAESREVVRGEEDREREERSVVECERVPRRVDSLELTAHPQLSSSSDQIRPEEIHWRQRHQRQLCLLLRRLRQQYPQEHSQL